jgi:hypothetical protein
MVVESLERPDQGPQSQGNVVTGPWRGPIYQDPDHADFYLPKVTALGGELIKVYATVRGTVHIWEIYKAGLKDKSWPFALMLFSGDPCEIGSHRDPQEATHIAMTKKAFVYNFKTRKAWRPVWFPSCPVEQRAEGNMAHETVDLYGWKSFMEGWADRPRARLFDND